MALWGDGSEPMIYGHAIFLQKYGFGGEGGRFIGYVVVGDDFFGEGPETGDFGCSREDISYFYETYFGEI